MPADLSRSVPFFGCPATQIDRLEARTDWLAARCADGIILFVADLLRRQARLEPADIKLNLQLEPFFECGHSSRLKTSFWNTVMIERSRRVSWCLDALSKTVSLTVRVCTTQVWGDILTKFAAFLVAACAKLRICFCKSLRGVWLRSSSKFVSARAAVTFVGWQTFSVFKLILSAVKARSQSAFLRNYFDDNRWSYRLGWSGTVADQSATTVSRAV